MKFTIAAACAAIWSSAAFAQANAQNDPQQSSQNTGASAASDGVAIQTTPRDDAQQPVPRAVRVGDPTVAPRPEGNPALATSTMMPPPSNNFDGLGLRGWDTPFPPASDSLIGDAGGIRTKLADYGIGFLGYSLNSFSYNLRGDNTPGANYNGRRPTYYEGSSGLFITYDASRIGLKGGQFQFQLNAQTNAANDLNGPKSFGVGGFAYFQPFLDDMFELKVGYLLLSNEFVGANVAGSFANGSLGPQAALVGVTGAAFPGLSTPGITFRYNAPNHFYYKAAVARSIPKQSTQWVVDNNSSGLRFSFPGARALVINEFGYNRPSAPGQNNLWFRAGGIYNWTQYTNFQTGGTSNNKGFYAGVDYQLTQLEPSMPYRGVYAGLSFTYAPPNTNLYSRYLEARVYGIGIIPGRPSDLASLVLTYNGFSRSALKTYYPGLDTANDTTSITASYAYRVLPGAFIQLGLGVVKNVEIYPKVDWALQAYLGINLIF